MRRIVAIGLTVVVCLAALLTAGTLIQSRLYAQSKSPVAAGNQPKFEVASVRVSQSNDYNSRGDPERLIFSGIPMRFLVGRAYGLALPDYYDRVSGPGWIDTQRYDVNAKLPPCK